jgi:putative transposase
LLAARSINVSVETIRNWCQKFGQRYCKLLKKNRGRLGDTWYLDKVFINIKGVPHYLWRAVDQDGDEVDILVQKCRNKKAAMKFFRKLLKGQQTVKLTVPHHAIESLLLHKTGPDQQCSGFYYLLAVQFV